MESLEFEYLTEITAYMLHALAESQSMGKLLSFCMLSKMSGTLRSSWRKTPMRLTGLNRSSPARPCRKQFHFYISCVYLHANNYILKGRASAAYERAMSDLESMAAD